MGSGSSGYLKYINLTVYSSYNAGYNLNQEYTNVTIEDIWDILMSISDDATFHFRNVNGYVESWEQPIFDIFAEEDNILKLYCQFAIPNDNDIGNDIIDSTGSYRIFFMQKKILGTTTTLSTIS